MLLEKGHAITFAINRRSRQPSGRRELPWANFASLWLVSLRFDARAEAAERWGAAMRIRYRRIRWKLNVILMYKFY